MYLILESEIGIRYGMFVILFDVNFWFVSCNCNKLYFSNIFNYLILYYEKFKCIIYSLCFVI